MSKFLPLKGKTIKSNSYGYFRVIDINSKYAEIVFIRTGFKSIVSPQSAANGSVKDKLYPSLYGVGYIGDGIYKSGSRGKAFKVYTTWKDMLRRCYSKESLLKHPTYKNVSVCIDWHNFQNFAHWYYENYPSDGNSYDLDKDKLSNGAFKVYSSRSCCFILCPENVEVSQAKSCKLISPEGVVFDVFNVSKFCRENGLHQGHITAVSNGKLKSYKGWSNYKITDRQIDELITAKGAW